MSDKKTVEIDSEIFQDSMSEISEGVAAAVTGVLEKIGTDTRTEEEIEIDEAQAVLIDKKIKWTNLFVNNGYDHKKKASVSIMDMAKSAKELASKATDAVTSEWYENLMPEIISDIIREPVEVGQPLTQLLTPVRFSQGNTITFPAVGPAGNLDLDMGEGEEYPILDLDLSGSVTATIGKSGIAVSFTEETLRYASFDVVGIHSRQAVQALRRHKEAKAADMIFSLGQTFIDNTDPAARKSKGRDINGAFNNTLIVDDLVDAAIDGIQEGWRYDTLVVNPLAWQIFAKDPILREQFFRGMAGGSFWQKPSGEAAYFKSLGSNSPYGKNLGPSVGLGGTNGSDLGGSQNASLSFEIPGYAGFGFNVIVSPYAPVSFDNILQKYVTDIVLLEAEHAGLLIIDEDINIDNWTDPTVDVHKMKFRERYALAQVNAGKAARVFKNIVIDRAYFMEDKVRYNIDGASGFPTVPGVIPTSSSSS